MQPKMHTNEFPKSSLYNIQPLGNHLQKGIVSVRYTVICYLSRACGFLPRSHFKAISACHSLPRIINHLGDSGIILNKDNFIYQNILRNHVKYLIAYPQPLIYNSNINPILNLLTLTNNYKVYVCAANNGSLAKEVISLLFKSFV